MNIIFNIDYKTEFGQEVLLNVVKGDSSTRYRMQSDDGQHWKHSIRISAAGTPFLDYFYSVETHGEEVRREWTTIKHRIVLNASRAHTYTIYDRWTDMPEDTYRYSSAFTDCINRMELKALTPSKYDCTLRIIVRSPQLGPGQTMALVGGDKGLGEWDTTKALPMQLVNYNTWSVDIDASTLTAGEQEMKFVMHDNHSGQTMWEECPNRVVLPQHVPEGEAKVYELEQAFFAIPNARLGGTLVPVFSLRTGGSFGVGDFGDLDAMIDFMAATSQKVLQILPINDTTKMGKWTDSYPYSCISIFALHPQYIDLRQLPKLADAKRAKYYEAVRQELNALPQIDYERVNQTKKEYLNEIFEQDGKHVIKSLPFKAFFTENEHWLVPYAQFCLLREKYQEADFHLWPDNHEWDEADRRALTDPRTSQYRAAAKYYYIQYQLSTQLQKAHDHARSLGIVLKGDIPIGVDRNGCDVWFESRYFNLNGQAGAPPDDFSVNGQNWGFPTYNWDAMLEDGCQWWIRRFQNMAHYFDAYRIDHVLGFFRIWEIPIHAVHGLLGQFSPSLGMTREEIENYGFNFQEELNTRPFIADWTVRQIFGDRAKEVTNKYLVQLYSNIYALKPEVATERQIEALFKDATSPEDIALRDGLYQMASDVLFLRDRKNPNLFHPRISAWMSFSFKTLYEHDKTAFRILYDDYFYHRNNQFWYSEAMKKLPVLVEATRMLVCAEDLGMVPACVEWVMNELRILSLEVESMPKQTNRHFGDVKHFPYRSVCCLGSHDMPTLRQWWDEDEDRTQLYYNTVLCHGGEAPHPLPGWLAREIILKQLQSPSMLCILSLQDYFAIDEQLRLADKDAERINIPANPRHYWRYRMHVSIEDLMANKCFKHNITGLMTLSDRK